MDRFRPRPSHANVMATVAVFIALGGGALAATSFVGSDGKIRGCVSKKGQLTLVKPGKHCKKGTPIAWNQKGAKGAPGANGTTIIARAHSTGSVVSTTSPTTVADPLVANSWQQAASEDDQIIGEINVDEPSVANCNIGGTIPGTLTGEIDVNGTQVALGGFADSASGATNKTVTGPSSPHFILAPGGSGRHDTLTIKFTDNCGGGGHFTVNSVRLHVLGAR